MATTYTADRADSAVQPRTHIGLNHVSEVFTVDTALALNDVIEMVWVPEGAIIHDLVLSCEDLDTGTAAITLSLGDGDDADRYITDSDIGQAGGMARLENQGGHMHTYSAADTIDVTVSTGPDTGATDVDIRLSVFYSLQE